MATDAILQVTDLHAGYGQSEVLHGLNFNVAPAEIVVVVGRNGMGKSTLMKSLIGMVPVKSGQIQLDGTDVTQFKSHRQVAKGIDQNQKTSPRNKKSTLAKCPREESQR